MPRNGGSMTNSEPTGRTERSSHRPRTGVAAAFKAPSTWKTFSAVPASNEAMLSVISSKYCLAEWETLQGRVVSAAVLQEPGLAGEREELRRKEKQKQNSRFLCKRCTVARSVK